MHVAKLTLYMYMYAWFYRSLVTEKFCAVIIRNSKKTKKKKKKKKKKKQEHFCGLKLITKLAHLRQVFDNLIFIFICNKRWEPV